MYGTILQPPLNFADVDADSKVELIAQAVPLAVAPPSILAPGVEEKPHTWLDTDLEEEDDSEDYVPESDETNSEELESDSNDGGISDSEVASLSAHAYKWRRAPFSTDYELAQEEREDLPRQIAELVKAEQEAAAAYDPDEVVSLITQFYELLIEMGHWPEGSLRYPPHTDPPVNEALAVELGYSPSTISIMQRLPYSTVAASHSDQSYILGCTRWADYTSEENLREGRHPYPYGVIYGCSDLDPWLLPLMLPNRDGWNVMLDTKLGVVRAYCDGPPEDTIEWRRHGYAPDLTDEARWTDYRRSTIVRAAHYFSELLYAYRSLSRLPIVDPDRNDPREVPRRYPNYPAPLSTQEKEEQETLLTLYRECGWPDHWRRAEFIAKWDAARDEIDARSLQAMQEQQGEG
ncbi:hypothetical protein B0H11DRAFT_2383033 [Mycena galericulata]|nr:hypothetical protein B0H11DRAFT_2383033 [Mycena galericulata]